MNKVMVIGLLVAVLVVGYGLYTDHTRNLNAAFSLSVEKMNQISGGEDEVPQCECPHSINYCKSIGSCSASNGFGACSEESEGDMCTMCTGAATSQACETRQTCVCGAVSSCSGVDYVACGYSKTGLCKSSICKGVSLNGSCVNTTVCN